TRTAQNRLPRLRRFAPGIATDRLQALHVSEVGQRQVTHDLRLAVGVARHDFTVRRNRHAGVFAGGEAVLIEVVSELAVVLGGAGVVDGDVQVFDVNTGIGRQYIA